MENINQKLKRLGLLDSTPKELLSLFTLDHVFVMFGKTCVNVIDLDEAISKAHPEYNCKSCTLEIGGKVRILSMKEAVLHFYGEGGLNALNALMH